MRAHEDAQKAAAAVRAVDEIEPGMVVGLGTGSTFQYALEEIARRLADGRLARIVGVPTSERTRLLAAGLGIPLADLDARCKPDVAIDGADEVDPDLQLIKGGGGALLREKIVAYASARLLIVVDAGKQVPSLGERAPVPVEVVPFGWRVHVPALEDLGARVSLRPGRDGQPFRTDEGHFILDCRFGGMSDPHSLAALLDPRPGIVDHGLFLDMADTVFVGEPQGGVTVRRR